MRKMMRVLPITKLLSIVLILAFLLACRQAFGQDALKLDGDTVKVKIKKTIIVEEDAIVITSAKFKLTAPPGGFQYRFQFPSGVIAVRKLNVLEITSAPKGSAMFSVEYLLIDFDKKQVIEKYLEATYNIGDVTPPVPPDPPPLPVPTVGPIKVLISYESSGVTQDLAKIISGAMVRDYMTAKGAKDGANVSFRAYDKDLDTSKELPWVQAADKRRRDKSGPASEWIVISDAKDAILFDGALPKTQDETLTLLKKFGG